MYGIGACSLGKILVARSAKGICALMLGDDAGTLENEIRTRFAKAASIENDAEFYALLAEVIAFVDQPAATFELPLDIRGTLFQQKSGRRSAPYRRARLRAMPRSPNASARRRRHGPSPRLAPPTRSLSRSPAIVSCAATARCPVIAGAWRGNARCWIRSAKNNLCVYSSGRWKRARQARQRRQRREQRGDRQSGRALIGRAKADGRDGRANRLPGQPRGGKHPPAAPLRSIGAEDNNVRLLGRLEKAKPQAAEGHAPDDLQRRSLWGKKGKRSKPGRENGEARGAENGRGQLVRQAPGKRRAEPDRHRPWRHQKAGRDLVAVQNALEVKWQRDKGQHLRAE